MEKLTIEDVQKRLPSRRKSVTQEVVDLINEAQNDPEFQGETVIQTLTTYESVMKNAGVGIKEYLNAIRFVAYLTTLNDNSTEAYKKTFQSRKFIQERMDVHTSSAKYKELSSAAARYRNSKLVVDLLTLSQAPLDLMFRGARYKAVGILAEVMETARLDRDKINAAKELLAATKGADNVKIELDVGVKESSAVTQLNDQLATLAARQKTLLEAGASTLGEFGALKVKEEDVIEGELVK